MRVRAVWGDAVGFYMFLLRPFTYMHVDLGAELGNCPRRLGHKQTKCVRTLKMLMRRRHFAARL